MSNLSNTVAVTATSSPGDVIITGGNRTGRAFLVKVLVTENGATAHDITIEYDIGSGHPTAAAGQHDIVSGWTLPVVGQQLLACSVLIFGDVADPDKLTMFLNSSGTVEVVVEVEEVI